MLKLSKLFKRSSTKTRTFKFKGTFDIISEHSSYEGAINEFCTYQKDFNYVTKDGWKCPYKLVHRHLKHDSFEGFYVYYVEKIQDKWCFGYYLLKVPLLEIKELNNDEQVTKDSKKFERLLEQESSGKD